jgi:hypothetical protein
MERRVSNGHLRIAADLVRYGTNEAKACVGFEVHDESGEPPWTYDRVVVQKHHDIAPCAPQALIRSAREAKVVVVRDHLNATVSRSELFEHAGRAVAGAVVHDEDFESRPGSIVGNRGKTSLAQTAISICDHYYGHFWKHCTAAGHGTEVRFRHAPKTEADGGRPSLFASEWANDVDRVDDRATPREVHQRHPGFEREHPMAALSEGGESLLLFLGVRRCRINDNVEGPRSGLTWDDEDVPGASRPDGDRMHEWPRDTAQALRYSRPHEAERSGRQANQSLKDAKPHRGTVVSVDAVRQSG